MALGPLAKPLWFPLASKACRSTSPVGQLKVALTSGAGAGSWTGISLCLHFFFLAEAAERLCFLHFFFLAATACPGPDARAAPVVTATDEPSTAISPTSSQRLAGSDLPISISPP